MTYTLTQVVLAIDPGYVESGYCRFTNGVPDMWGKASNWDLIRSLRKRATADFTLAIEMVQQTYGGSPVGPEVFQTVCWSGQFIEAIQSAGGVALRFGRKEVVTHLTGSARGKDKDVRAAVIRRYGEPGTKKNPGLVYGMTKDAWQACGLGLLALDKAAGPRQRRRSSRGA